MYRKWFSVVMLFVVATLLLIASSCAHNQHLVGIQVIPPGPVTFQGVGASIQFKAVGTYIHPPETKDITNIVTWSVDSQNLVQMQGPGFFIATSVCGSGNVYASFNDPPNNVIGSAFVTGNGIGTAACNQGLLSVSIVGSGTVTSPSAVISCPGKCSAIFPLNSAVTLTAAPGAGANSVSWTGCAPSGNTCTVTLSGNVTVTATFN